MRTFSMLCFPDPVIRQKYRNWEIQMGLIQVCAHIFLKSRILGKCGQKNTCFAKTRVMDKNLLQFVTNSTTYPYNDVQTTYDTFIHGCPKGIARGRSTAELGDLLVARALPWCHRECIGKVLVGKHFFSDCLEYVCKFDLIPRSTVDQITQGTVLFDVLALYWAI